MRRFFCLTLCVFVSHLVENADAQEALPVPAVPQAPKAITIPGVTVHPSPPKPTIVQTLASAKRGICAHIQASPIGKLTAGMRKPLSTVTGGLIPAEKAPHPDEHKQPGPEGAAAQIKSVKIQAPKRQAAIKELKAIDVRYHPEAEAILIAALRADPSECVRFEAAQTLATIPVCSKPIADALTVCVDGKNTDGNPVELSERVKLQAAAALASCECCMPPTAEENTDRPEYPFTGVAQASATMPLNPAGDSLLPISSALYVSESMPQASEQLVEPARFELAGSAATTLPAKTDIPQAKTTAKTQSASRVTEDPRKTNARRRPTSLFDIFRAAAAKGPK